MEKAALCDQPFWKQRAVATEDSGKPIAFESGRLEGTCHILLSNKIKIKNTSVLKGSIIVSRPALHHDVLDRPVAFVGGEEIVPLMSQIRPGQMVQEVIQSWSRHLSADLSWRIMHWLWFAKNRDSICQ